MFFDQLVNYKKHITDKCRIRPVRVYHLFLVHISKILNLPVICLSCGRKSLFRKRTMMMMVTMVMVLVAAVNAAVWPPTGGVALPEGWSSRQRRQHAWVQPQHHAAYKLTRSAPLDSFTFMPPPRRQQEPKTRAKDESCTRSPAVRSLWKVCSPPPFLRACVRETSWE